LQLSRRADEPIEPFRYGRAPHLDTLAQRTARWAADNADRIRESDPMMPAGVYNRVADNWHPLRAVADAAGGDWPEHARSAIAATASGTTDDESAGVLALRDIEAIFGERKADRLSSTDLVDAMVAIEGRPWAEWRGGKPITPNGLARVLKAFGIVPITIRIGAKTPKGYRLADFGDVFGLQSKKSARVRAR
jgi:hypothetical protein